MTIINRGSVGLTAGAITTATFGAGAIDAAAIAANAIGSSELAVDAVVEITGTVVNAGGVATLGAVLGDMANNPVAARLTTIAGYVDGLEASVGTLVNTGQVPPTLAGILGDVANSSIAARLTTIAGYVDGLEAAVGTLVNTGGTATVAGILGDPRGSTLAALLGNMGGQLVSKEITYAAATTSYTAFNVTGLVAVKVVGYVTTALTDHANETSVGTATSAGGLIAATPGSSMQTAGQVWVDSVPTKFETFPANWTLIGDGEDIAVVGTSNLVAGVVDLYCWYIPISAGASVVSYVVA